MLGYSCDHTKLDDYASNYDFKIARGSPAVLLAVTITYAFEVAHNALGNLKKRTFLSCIWIVNGFWQFKRRPWLVHKNATRRKSWEDDFFVYHVHADRHF